MPIVQAYECPRTRKLFKDKTKYIHHLKIAAYKDFKDSDESARLTIFKNKFEAARKTVRSFQELASWMELHTRDLNRLAVKFGSIHPKFALEVTPLTEIRFEGMQRSPDCSNQRQAPRHGVVNYKRSFELPYGYAGAVGLFKFHDEGNLGLSDVLRKLWPIHFGGGGGRDSDFHYECRMFAEDWPFIGVTALHGGYAQSEPVDEGQLRILRYAFPGLPVEQYLSLHGAGLLPAAASDFGDYMFQFVDIPTAQLPHAPVNLPATIAFD